MRTGQVMNLRVFGLTIAAAAFGLDQSTKWLVTYPLALRTREVIDILPFFSLRWAENYGISLSYFEAESTLGLWTLIAVTGLIAGAVAVWLWRERNPFNVTGLGFILGGALGNITDRIRFGHVIDFLDLHLGWWRPFAIFSVADCMISFGVVSMLFTSWLHREKHSSANLRPRQSN